jgi:hypothetical protein
MEGRCTMTIGHSATIARFDDRLIAWRRFAGEGPLTPDEIKSVEGLEYWVLGVDQQNGIVDILLRMKPQVMCTPHIHVGRTTTLVVEGEHRNLSRIDDE